MALPKRRHSKSRRNNRRARWKASAPAVSICSNCSQPKPSHRICPNCGYYGGREIVAMKRA